VVRLTICYIKFIIYAMFLNIIREATTVITKLGSVKVYWVIL